MQPLKPAVSVDSDTINKGDSVALTLNSNEESRQSVTRWDVHWANGSRDIIGGDTAIYRHTSLTILQ